jgi:hypothetical protein
MTANQTPETIEITPKKLTLTMRQSYGLNKAIYEKIEAKGFEIGKMEMANSKNDIIAKVFYRKPGNNPEDYHCTIITVGPFGWVKSVVKEY